MPECILIIDPSTSRRTSLCNKLALGRYDTLAADSAQTARPLLRLQKPDLIICDASIFSPTIRAIRSDPSGLDTPIIVLGRVRNATAPSGLLRRGADCSLPEDVEKSLLNDQIRHLIKRRDMRREDQMSRPWALCEKTAPFLAKS